MINILHINSNYLYTSLHEKLIEQMNKFNDISNTVFMPHHGETKFVLNPNDYVYQRICFNKMDRFLYYYKQKKIYSCLKKTVDVQSFSLTHAHTLFTDGNIAYRLYQKYKIPYIVAVRNVDVNVFFKKRVFLRNKGLKILTNAKKVIFISRAYQDIVVNKYVPEQFRKDIEEKSIVIPNGIDEFWLNNKYYSKNHRDLKELNLIFAGRIDRNKNIGTTIKACKLLINQGINVNLTVVGRIENHKEYKEIINNNFVKYITQQPKERLIDYYRSSNIFIMPSKTETFGLVYAEAMTQGLPVIYTKGEGFDGQFKEGFVGYHVNCYNPKEIADRIIDIINNYPQLSENSAKLSQKFDWRLIGEKYKNIYESFSQ